MPGLLIWLLFAVALLFSFALGRKDARTPDLRRGGFVKLRVSPTQSLGTILELSETETTAPISSPYPHGGVSGAWEARRLLRDPSRITGRGWSIAGTEALGANGVRREAAA